MMDTAAIPFSPAKESAVRLKMNGCNGNCNLIYKLRQECRGILAFKGGLAMNKDFGCCCGILADMIIKYAPEIKDAYNIDTLQQCRVFFLLQKVHRLATV